MTSRYNVEHLKSSISSGVSCLHNAHLVLLLVPPADTEGNRKLSHLRTVQHLLEIAFASESVCWAFDGGFAST